MPSAFAREMRCEPDFVQGMRKQARTTEFACWVKNTTPHAIKLDVPLGVVNSMPRIDLAAYDLLIGANRARYCSLGAERDDAPKMFSKEVVTPRRSNKGGFELDNPPDLL